MAPPRPWSMGPPPPEGHKGWGTLPPGTELPSVPPAPPPEAGNATAEAAAEVPPLPAAAEAEAAEEAAPAEDPADPVVRVRQELHPTHWGPLQEEVQYLVKRTVDVFEGDGAQSEGGAAATSQKSIGTAKEGSVVVVTGPRTTFPSAGGGQETRVPIASPKGWVCEDALESFPRLLTSFTHLQAAEEGNLEALRERDEQLREVLEEDPGVLEDDAIAAGAMKLYRKTLLAFDPEPEIRRLLFQAVCRDDAVTLKALLDLSGLPLDNVVNAGGLTLMDVAIDRQRWNAMEVLEAAHDAAAEKQQQQPTGPLSEQS